MDSSIGDSHDHVGFTATLHGLDRQALTEQLEALIEPPGFTGNAPGGPSRWSTERSGEWQPLRSEHNRRSEVVQAQDDPEYEEISEHVVVDYPQT